ncbi:MAG TPA: hypothetical protein VL651_03415 [Bacteroidia bacterium]|jgi:hypothetical protein|nr:hypothetical protein [Bacteroidia bacterium]
MVVRVIILIAIISSFLLLAGFFFNMYRKSKIREEDYSRGQAMIITPKQFHFSIS